MSTEQLSNHWHCVMHSDVSLLLPTHSANWFCVRGYFASTVRREHGAAGWALGGHTWSWALTASHNPDTAETSALCKCKLPFDVQNCIF